MNPKLPITAFASWLAAGERGLSSEAIVAHLTGHPVGRSYRTGRDFPHDPDDLRRCELLLRQVPIARLMFPTMCEVSPTWAALVDAWDELVALMEQEAPDCFSSGRGAVPLTYARMQELRSAAAVVGETQ